MHIMNRYTMKLLPLAGPCRAAAGTILIISWQMQVCPVAADLTLQCIMNSLATVHTLPACTAIHVPFNLVVALVAFLAVT